eukprot:2971127-Amphidinium_carterae.1
MGFVGKVWTSYHHIVTQEALRKRATQAEDSLQEVSSLSLPSVHSLRKQRRVLGDCFTPVDLNPGLIVSNISFRNCFDYKFTTENDTEMNRTKRNVPQFGNPYKYEACFKTQETLKTGSDQQ